MQQSVLGFFFKSVLSRQKHTNFKVSNPIKFISVKQQGFLDPYHFFKLQK